MYVRAVRQLVEHYHTSPARITEEEVRDYFLYLKNVKHYSRSASTIALCGIKFFYEHTLKREWSTLTFVRAPREKKLPVILSVEEVRTLLAHLKLLRYRACLTTIYSCGLRLQEGAHLQVPDIDSARMLVHVRSGKGAKDRYVPLLPRTLELLRQYWKTHRHPLWLFPAPGRGGIGMATASGPMPRNSVQNAFRAALKHSGIHTRAMDPRIAPASATVCPKATWPPCRLSNSAAQKLLAVMSPSAQIVVSWSTAIIPARIGIAPSVKMRRPRNG